MRELKAKTSIVLVVEGKAGADTDHLPFRAEADLDRIRLHVPSYAHVELLEGWHARQIFDGRGWTALGVLPETRELSLEFRLHSVIRLSAQGKTWIVRVPALQTRSSLKNVIREWAGFTRSVGSSVAAHALTVFAVILLLQLSGRVTGPLEKEVELKPEEKPKEQPAGGGVGQVQFFPFMGMTYAQFLKMIETPEERVQNQLAKLTKNLGGLMKGLPGVNTAKLGSGLGKGGFGVPGGTGTSLSARVGDQKILVPEKSAKGGALTDAERELLRKKFREVQDDFKRIYSRLLTEDPQLSVTMSFEAVVGGNGYFSLRNVKARGTYKPHVLAKLQSGMAESVRSVFVSPKLAGTVLRGESVFVH